MASRTVRLPRSLVYICGLWVATWILLLLPDLLLYWSGYSVEAA
ncbi:unnamed protein product, partial [marine sediment metagenome]